MYRQMTLGEPGCLRFRPTPLAQYNAAQNLIRPWEVEPLIKRYRRRNTGRGTTFASSVARWLKIQLNSERLEYMGDPDFPRDMDYWCSPSTTLRRGGGDCEDFSILAVSLLLAGDVEAYLITGEAWTGDDFQGHAWVEGWDDRGFFLLEAISGDLSRYRPSEYQPELLLGPGVFRIAS